VNTLRIKKLLSINKT